MAKAETALDRRGVIAGLPEMDQLVDQRVAEAALVSDGFREGFGLVD